MLKPVERSTLHESVLKEMLSAIKKGYWKPGDRIPGEMALAAKFCVSRNCIREVMKALSFFGIIDAKPGQGTFLSENALRNIRNTELLRLISGQSSIIELMEVRLLIETQAAYWAAERATEEEIVFLQEILDEEKARSEPAIDIHAKFHDAIVKLSNNNLLIHLYDSIKTEIAHQREKFEKWPLRELRAFAQQHQKILDQIRERNPQGARDLMHEHIISSLQLTLDDVEETKEEPSKQDP